VDTPDRHVGYTGEYGFLLLGMILSMNPLLMLSLIAGLIVYVLAYLGAAVFSFYLYIVLELAIVYAVADEAPVPVRRLPRRENDSPVTSGSKSGPT